MLEYTIKDYQKGFEKDQARIGIEVAKKWIWPYAYSYEELVELYNQPDFDPETRHYCYLDDKMVGYIFYKIIPDRENAHSEAILDFPRVLPGHKHVAELLMTQALASLKTKGVQRVSGFVNTMSPETIQLVDKTGFSIYDWGFKVYYAYEMAWGKLDDKIDDAVEIDPSTDLDDISQMAAIWYKRPPEWCRSHLIEWHDAGIITHVGVRKEGRWVSACLTARNDVIPSKAALFYVYTQDTDVLMPIVKSAVNRCVDDGGINILIADLINEHRSYESVYQNLGFQKVADWAKCEKILS